MATETIKVDVDANKGNTEGTNNPQTNTEGTNTPQSETKDTNTPQPETKDTNTPQPETKGTDSTLSDEDKANKTIEDAKKAETEVKKVLDTKGISFEDCSKEYLDKGVLSKETYDKLDKAGFNKTVVDAYIAGVVAKGEQVRTTIINGVGGQEEFNKVAKYIQSKGNSAIDAYNALIDGDNVSAINMFLNGVKAEMTLQNGTANRTILGAQSTSKGTNGYANQAEMAKAMSDPRYGVDEDYTNEVGKKLAVSDFIKFNN